MYAATKPTSQPAPHPLAMKTQSTIVSRQDQEERVLSQTISFTFRSNREFFRLFFFSCMDKTSRPSKSLATLKRVAIPRFRNTGLGYSSTSAFSKGGFSEPAILTSHMGNAATMIIRDMLLGNYFGHKGGG